MIVWDNGVYREATPAEEDEYEAWKVLEQNRPRTTEEILADLLSSIEGGLSDG